MLGMLLGLHTSKTTGACANSHSTSHLTSTLLLLQGYRLCTRLRATVLVIGLTIAVFSPGSGMQANFRLGESSMSP